MKVHFIRHGESVSNASPGAMALPGVEGDRLTDRGWEQARAVGRHLAGLGATRILTSPLQRARETAEAVAETVELPIVELEELRELRESDRYGELSLDDQRLKRWSIWMSEHGEDPDHSYRGGESFNEIVARVRLAKQRLLADPEPSVIAVSHGIFMRFFFAETLFAEGFHPGQVAQLWQLGTFNCGLSVFEHSEPEAEANFATKPWRCLSWMERPWTWTLGTGV